MFELVKLRKVAGSVVVSLPRHLLGAVGLECGDRVVVQPGRGLRHLTIQKAAQVVKNEKSVGEECQRLKY